MIALTAALLASLTLADLTAERAVAAALAAPIARAELTGLRGATPRGCAAQSWSAPRPVASSGPVALRFEGRGPGGARCEGWAWADVKVYAPALRLTRDVRSGERLEGAVEAVELEVTQGRSALGSLPSGAVASRELRAGAALAGSDLRVGPAPGDPVTLLVRSGGVELSLPARALGCGRAAGCAALLPGGRRVEGRWDGARIAVEAR